MSWGFGVSFGAGFCLGCACTLFWCMNSFRLFRVKIMDFHSACTEVKKASAALYDAAKKVLDSAAEFIPNDSQTHELISTAAINGLHDAYHIREPRQAPRLQMVDCFHLNHECRCAEGNAHRAVSK